MKSLQSTQAVWVVFSLIALLLIARLIPHPPNFTPVLAVALFCGALAPHLVLAVLIPLTAVILSDWVLGWHASAWAVYLAVILCAGLGRWMLSPPNGITTLIGGVCASALFFALTNFAVWLQGDLYPLTGAGLLACYLAAIPFFHNTLVATLLFGLGLLAGFRYFQHHTNLFTTSNG